MNKRTKETYLVSQIDSLFSHKNALLDWLKRSVVQKLESWMCGICAICHVVANQRRRFRPEKWLGINRGVRTTWTLGRIHYILQA